MPNSSIQPSTHTLSVDQFRRLASEYGDGSYKLKDGHLEIAKRKFFGMSVFSGPGPGKQNALAAFKEALTERYGATLANMTLASMGAKEKLKTSSVRALDYHLGQARERLEHLHLKPAEFDTSVARLASNMKLKMWVSEIKDIKDPARQQQLVNQGITDVYNHYESKLGQDGGLADRATVLQNGRWKEFTEFVSNQFSMPVVKPSNTAEENGVEIVEASLMHAQFTQLKDVLDGQGKNWFNNGRTGSVQLLMASAMLDKMNGMWLEHKGEKNTDWRVSSESGNKNVWATTSTNVKKSSTKIELSGTASAGAKIEGEFKKEGVITDGLAYKVSHKHSAFAEAKASGSVETKLFMVGASANLKVEAEAEAEVEAGVHGKQAGSITYGSLARGSFTAEEFAGARATVNASAGVTVSTSDGSPIGIKAEAGFDAFAGAEAKGTLMGEFFKPEFLDYALKAHVEGHARAGAGVSGSAKVEFTTENIEFKASASGTAGVGAGGGFDININPMAMMACGNAALSAALGRFDVELGNIFDERAIQNQNTVLLNEVETKMQNYLAQYRGEVDSSFDADIRMRDELRSVTVDEGLDYLGGLDKSALRDKLRAGAEAEAEKLESDKAFNPNTDSRRHVVDSVTEDLIRNMARSDKIKV